MGVYRRVVRGQRVREVARFHESGGAVARKRQVRGDGEPSAVGGGRLAKVPDREERVARALSGHLSRAQRHVGRRHQFRGPVPRREAETTRGGARGDAVVAERRGNVPHFQELGKPTPPPRRREREGVGSSRFSGPRRRVVRAPRQHQAPLTVRLCLARREELGRFIGEAVVDSLAVSVVAAIRRTAAGPAVAGILVRRRVERGAAGCRFGGCLGCCSAAGHAYFQLAGRAVLQLRASWSTTIDRLRPAKSRPTNFALSLAASGDFSLDTSL